MGWLTQDSLNRAMIYIRRYLLAVVLVFGLLALGWWRNATTSKRVEIDVAGSKTVMDMGSITSVHPLDVDTRQRVQFTSAGDGPKRLLVFLTAADCYSCLAQIGDWIGLAKS